VWYFFTETLLKFFDAKRG